MHRMTRTVVATGLGLGLLWGTSGVAAAQPTGGEVGRQDCLAGGGGIVNLGINTPTGVPGNDTYCLFGTNNGSRVSGQ
jgi:hypothetical protein